MLIVGDRVFLQVLRCSEDINNNSLCKDGNSVIDRVVFCKLSYDLI